MKLYSAKDLKPGRLQTRVIRARRAIGRGTKYKLGQGGFHPIDTLPTRTGYCDCSGFVAWVLGLDRWQGRHNKRHSSAMPWIETTAMVRDANGKGLLFVKLDGPVPGCIVVYGDSFGRQGHTGIVDNVRGPKDFDVVHCSVGNDRSGDAIQRTHGSLFVKKKAIFITLREDLECPIQTPVINL